MDYQRGHERKPKPFAKKKHNQSVLERNYFKYCVKKKKGTKDFGFSS
jgi:hypothetical protein